MTEVPVQLGHGDINTFDIDSNLRMTNWVANQAYNRYDRMIPDIRKVQALEGKFRATRAAKEAELSAMAAAGDIAALTAAVNKEGRDSQGGH